MPASFEVNGRQMIVIPAASGLGSNALRINGKPFMQPGEGAYIAYALPSTTPTTH